MDNLSQDWMWDCGIAVLAVKADNVHYDAWYGPKAPDFWYTQTMLLSTVFLSSSCSILNIHLCILSVCFCIKYIVIQIVEDWMELSKLLPAF